MQQQKLARRTFMALSAFLIAACASAPATSVASSQEPEVADIWAPGTMIGRPQSSTPERQRSEQRGHREVTLFENVTHPTVTVVRPAPGRATGAAMIVLPGGGFNSLLWDLEGTEIANYLAERGVTAFVLKYRVREPTPEQLADFYREPTGARLMVVLADNVNEATEDALQTVRFVRANASRFRVDPNRVGMIGFSAGAITTLRVLHAADDASRPNLAASIYGFDTEQSAPAVSPPLFLAHARDDAVIPAAASEAVAAAWRGAGASVDLHIYETGNHAFALGHPGTASAAFAGEFEAWLAAQGFLQRR